MSFLLNRNMKRIELIYRDILYGAFEGKTRRFTQLGFSKKFNMSLSLVHHALKPLVKMNAVEVKSRECIVIDPKKVLYHWASKRNVEKDIIVKARINVPVRDIERSMRSGDVYGAYSAYKFLFHDVPADYSEVYMYGNLAVHRGLKPSNNPNVFMLKKDTFLDRYGKTTTIAQTFVDLWNIKSWYAKEFVTALGKKLGELYGILE